MDFIDDLRALSAKIQKQQDKIQNEAATKTAFVMPFIGALGYNVFDPTEVTPEYTTEIGGSKDEKVDYAIFKDGEPVILFECKWRGADLDKENHKQLAKYFAFTRAKFGIFTNGILYRFYSDLDDNNKMDKTPFLEFDMLNIKDSLVEELKKFSKSSFDLNSLSIIASKLKYMTEIERIIEEQVNEPSDEFVKFFASQVYPGKLTQPVRDQFALITKETFKQFINDKINDRLNIALDAGKTPPLPPDKPPEPPENEKLTDEERDGYFIIRSLLRAIVDPSRLFIHKKANYCAVLLDDTSHKRIARLYLDPKHKYIGIFDEQKQEEMVDISTIDDIYKLEGKLEAIVRYYDTRKSGRTSKSLISFMFKGQRYETKHWKDLLIRICGIMAELHKDRFDEILTLSGTKKPFFSKNPADLRSPDLIEGTDVFAEVNLSSDSILKLSKKVIEKFGYPESELSIEAQ